MKYKIPFSGRAHQFSKDEIDSVILTMNEADPLTQGKYRDEFEKKFSEYINSKYCYTCCNATAALEMTAQLCRFKQGHEIIAPSHTFTASVYPFIKKGAKVVWADIDLQTRVVTPETILDKITPKTTAIIVVHLYGYMADMPAINEVAQKHNLIVIEDAAQSMGTNIHGQYSGTFGDFGVYSFHSHKNISTLGEGGMLHVKDNNIAKIIPMLHHNGHCAFDFSRDDYWIPAMGNVDFPLLDGEKLWPNNYCLGEVECALGIKLLDRIDIINSEKRARALFFIDELKDFHELEFHRVESSKHNYHLLAARMSNGKRNEFIRKMALEKSIQCVVQYYPLNRYPLYQKCGLGEADCPNADNFFDNMVSFPFHHHLSDDDFKYMLESSKDVLLALREENRDR